MAGNSSSPLSGLRLAKTIAGLAHDKKAAEITILDMRKVANFCDYFVLCTGTSDRHSRAIAEGVEDGLREKGEKVPYKQGLKDAHWVVLDLGDVIVHVFNAESREFYGLDHLWQEAKKITWPSK